MEEVTVEKLGVLLQGLVLVMSAKLGDARLEIERNTLQIARLTRANDEVSAHAHVHVVEQRELDVKQRRELDVKHANSGGVGTPHFLTHTHTRTRAHTHTLTHRHIRTHTRNLSVSLFIFPPLCLSSPLLVFVFVSLCLSLSLSISLTFFLPPSFPPTRAVYLFTCGARTRCETRQQQWQWHW